MVSIIILTHNALEYIRTTLESLKANTDNIEYEAIVVDNASGFGTQKALLEYKGKGFIDKLLLLNENTFFARGNNMGAKLASRRSEWLLLLNSDVEVRDGSWLRRLVGAAEKEKAAVASYGCCLTPKGRPMADGYCILFRKKVFERVWLNEGYEWHFGLPWAEAEILRMGHKVIAVNNHERYVHHYGGKSGDDWKNAKGMGSPRSLYDKMFGGG